VLPWSVAPEVVTGMVRVLLLSGMLSGMSLAALFAAIV
jgi:hypothetical protein